MTLVEYFPIPLLINNVSVVLQGGDDALMAHQPCNNVGVGVLEVTISSVLLNKTLLFPLFLPFWQPPKLGKVFCSDPL